MPLNAGAIFPASDPDFVSFRTRRSVVHSTNGIVACTQPLAAQAGQRILRDGGNAADAAVAVAAALNMTEPASTGIGGDMFCLFYNAKTKTVESLNGSGRSPAAASLEQVRKALGLQKDEAGVIPMSSVHAVTVPGAAAGWVDTVQRFGNGRVGLDDILQPAIELGEDGFPVSELSSYAWRQREKFLYTASPNSGEMLKDDPAASHGMRAPRPGELFKNPGLASTFRQLATGGKDAFYTGSIGEELVRVVRDLGGHLSMQDLEYHLSARSENGKPIALRFNGQKIGSTRSPGIDGQDVQTAHEHGVDVWEHPPNGQGVVALMALGILEELEKNEKIPSFSEKGHNSAIYLHAVIEALRIAFADGTWFVTDPDFTQDLTSDLLSPSYLASRAKIFDPKQATSDLAHGSPAQQSSDTVYFSVTDAEGNACSFVNSNYGQFGTGIVPKGCGFVLQNRGANFSLDGSHPNVYAPKKRPYHTIIPAMVTNPDDGSLHTVYGVMGGFMQPQGHVQVLLNMLVFGMNPQTALDAPRFCIGAGTPEMGKLLDKVYLEDGIGEDVAEELRRLGHKVEIVTGFERGLFGRGQVIRCHMEDGRHVYSAGSDPRGDGAAFPV